MPSDNINTQAGTAGEATGETTTNLIPDEGAPAAVTVIVTVPAAVADDAEVDVDVDDGPIVKLRIKTSHIDCGGIISGRNETEVDPTVLCGKPTTLPALVSRPHPTLKASSSAP